MKRWIIILSLVLNTTACHQKSNSVDSSKGSVQPSVDQRTIASVNTQKNSESTTPKKTLASIYPSTTVKFLKGEPQRVRIQSTIKQYKNILPNDVYTRMMELSKKVDDRGLSIQRYKDELLLDNQVMKLRARFTGDIGNIQTTINGKTYSFLDKKNINDFLAELEKKLQTTKQSSNVNNLNSNLVPYQASLNNIPNTLAYSFMSTCSLLNLLFISTDSNSAIPMGALVFGGLALIALAIAYGVSKMGSNLKKTEHTINHKVGLNTDTENSIDALTKAIKDIDPNINVNIDTSTLGNGLGLDNLDPEDLESNVVK